MGHHDAYTDEQKEKISEKVLTIIADGFSVVKACEKVGVARGTFLRWVSDDKKLADRYYHSRMAMLDCIGDDLIDLSDQIPNTLTDEKTGGIKYDGAAVHHLKNRIDTRKWLLSRLNPSVYSERTQSAVDHTSSDGSMTPKGNMTQEQIAEVLESKGLKNPFKDETEDNS